MREPYKCLDCPTMIHYGKRCTKCRNTADIANRGGLAKDAGKKPGRTGLNRAVINAYYSWGEKEDQAQDVLAA